MNRSERMGGRRPGRAMQSHSDRSPDEKLTVDEVCAELKISRSTLYERRQKRRGPCCIRLPNGALRVRRSDFDHWQVWWPPADVVRFAEASLPVYQRPGGPFDGQPA